jgi:hypothetical protein
MITKNKWFIGAGVMVGLIVLFALPFVWQALFSAQSFGMHSGMGSGFFPMFGGMGLGMFFVWLIPLALLTLVGLSIAALIKYLSTPSAK